MKRVRFTSFLKPILFIPLLILFYTSTDLRGQVRQRWGDRYNGSADTTDVAVDVTVDGNGDIYTTGYCYNSGVSWDIMTRKYAPDGTALWTQVYNGPADGRDIATAITIDEPGYVIVTGYHHTSTADWDYFTRRYTHDGSEKWTTVYNGPEDNYDVTTGLVTDGNGNIYVTGYSRGIGTAQDSAPVSGRSVTVP